jgi:uncharacterized membrane protein YgcG
VAQRNLKFVLLIAALLTLCACDSRHKATIYKTKKHHIVMKDDRGRWWEYTLKGMSDVDFDIPFNPRGEMVLPQGGGWRPATIQEEEEVTVEAQATNAEETTVDETDAGAPDGTGDVGGDSGGGAGDSGGDGGDGGGGDD